MKSQYFKWVIFLVIMVIPVWIAHGGDDCPIIVQKALDTTGQFCEATGRNQACYGYSQISATAQAGISDFKFQQPGDITAVDKIRSLNLSPMELASDSWGIALMRLQADLPQSNTGNITMLAFGDVQLENAVSENILLAGSVKTTVNVRSAPDAQAAVIGTLNAGENVSVSGRTLANTRYRVQMPSSADVGWVSVDALSVQGDLSTLEVITPTTPTYQPMQAFYFQAGDDQPVCAEMPRNGLLIQTPEGAGEIRLWINEVQVHMGSTVYFEAQPSGQMTVTTLEGHARVETMGVSHTAFAGSSVSVLLNADMKPAAPPSEAFAYDASQFQNLPLGLLQRPITVHPALTPQELVTAAQNDAAIPVITTTNNTSTDTTTVTNITTTTDDNTTDTGNKDCPGNSCHDQCPGNSCDSNGVGNPNTNGDNSSSDDHGNGNGSGHNTGEGNNNGRGGNGNGNGNKHGD